MHGVEDYLEESAFLDPSKPWSESLAWWDGVIILHNKGKGWRVDVLRSAAAETIYDIWRYCNDKCLGNNVDNTKIMNEIIDIIVYSGWYIDRLRTHIANLMM